VADHLEKIARSLSLPISEGFKFLAFVQGKYGAEIGGNNIRAAIDLLPDALRRHARAARAAAPDSATSAE
jgi:hypothetical protein